jgi:hypothetical protein
MSRETQSPSESAWYIVRTKGDVAGGEEIVAGPLSEKTAADRLAESFGPDHVVRSRSALVETGSIDPR